MRNMLVDEAETGGIPCRLGKVRVCAWGDLAVVRHYPKVVLGMIQDCDALIRAY